MPMSEPPAKRSEVMTVSGEDRAVGRVRAWLRDLVGARHPRFDDLAVCVSEVMTNALRYTDSGRGGRIRLRLTVTHAELRAEIWDDGGAATVPHRCGRSTVIPAGRDGWAAPGRGAPAGPSFGWSPGSAPGPVRAPVRACGAGAVATRPRGDAWTLAERGRGLWIVDAYADDWGVEPRGGGHLVWISLLV